MKISNKIAKFLLVSLLGGLFVILATGCETSDDTKAAAAQACLDAARSAPDASACVAKVDGIESPQASAIRCGGIYMQRAFFTTKWTQIFNEINNKTATGDPMLRMLTYIGFSGGAAVDAYTGYNSTNDSLRVSDECIKSGSAGMSYLALATRLATEFYNGIGVAAGETPTLAQMQAQLPNLNNATVGAIALQAAQANCTGSNATSTQCTDINAAIATGGGDTAAIGAALKNLLAN